MKIPSFVTYNVYRKWCPSLKEWKQMTKEVITRVNLSYIMLDLEFVAPNVKNKRYFKNWDVYHYEYVNKLERVIESCEALTKLTSFLFHLEEFMIHCSFS